MVHIVGGVVGYWVLGVGLGRLSGFGMDCLKGGWFWNEVFGVGMGKEMDGWRGLVFYLIRNEGGESVLAFVSK